MPIKIDPADYPREIGLINNRNKFILGPSGTGKSFLMNSIIERYMEYDMDIVVIDTGDSYSGINHYFKGKYITYKEDKPITMNPFKIDKEEWNIEKIDFLQNLIFMLWKGADAEINKTEEQLITTLINTYYDMYFNKCSYTEENSYEELLKKIHNYGVKENNIEEEAQKIFESSNAQYYTLLNVAEDATDEEIKESYRLLAKKYHPDITEDKEAQKMFPLIVEAYQTLINEKKRKLYDSSIKDIILYKEKKQNSSSSETALIKIKKEILIQKLNEYSYKFEVKELSFNSFYEFASLVIPELIKNNGIEFDCDNFVFVLQRFYKGGQFETILNEDADLTLFDEKFIVFEIDNIKENKTLFPIVTLIIMDVFIQKMRRKKNSRKALIIEEAWKAVANKLMGGYITYLYKTVRKFWGECIVVTQELNDIIGNAVVKDSIVNNSDSLILLDQTKFKDNFSQIAEILSLNEVEQTKIFTINNLDNKSGRRFFKEFYYKRGSRGEVFGNEVSIEQHLAFTTEKPEKNAVEIYIKKYGSFETAITNLVEQLKNSGLELKELISIINTKGDVLTKEDLQKF